MPTIRLQRNRKGQFVARAHSSNPHRKKKHHRKNYYGGGGVVPYNPPRKKHRRNPPNPHRRRRRNPPLVSTGGVSGLLPNVGTLIGVTGGVVGPTAVTLLTNSFAPSIPMTLGPTGMRIGSNLATIGLGYMLAGKSGARNVALGELVTLAAGFISTAFRQWLAPAASSTTGGTTVSGYLRPRMNVGGYVSGTVPRSTLADNPSRSTRFQSRFHRMVG